MALSPDILRKVDDLMRGDLQAYRDAYFHCLLYSIYLVVVGLCLEGPEVVHDFRNLFRASDLERKASKWIKFAATVGWLCIVLGVAGEAYFDARVSSGDTQLQAFNTSLLIEAQREGTNAETSAANAILFAGDASASAKRANDSARQSGLLAKRAHQEADSFEAQIVIAKRQAAAAESDLADARQRAANALRQAASATAELKRLRSPRSLRNVQAMVVALKMFRGTKYTFSGISPDNGSEALLAALDSALQAAGWKRVRSACHLPVFTYSGFKDEPKFCISEATSDGLRISIQYPGGLAALRSLSHQTIPRYVRAARDLYMLVNSALYPPSEGPPARIAVTKGPASTVFISVGRKQ